jgi:hypothetical protein
MRALSIAICLAASTPALAAEIYPATGSVLPPQPSLFVEGTPELTLNVTSNDRLVPYTVVATSIPNLVRVDVSLAAGSLRIGRDGAGTVAEYVVAEPMPHRIRVDRREAEYGYALAIASDAALFRLEWSDGRVAVVPNVDTMELDRPAPVRVIAMWSDRSEQAIVDDTPRLSCGLRHDSWRREVPPEDSRALKLGLLAVLAGLGLAIQRRVSRGSSAW